MVQKQLPTGFRDDIGAVAERKDDVSQYLLGLCRSRQYTKISTPLVEYKDVFNGYAMGRGQHMYEFMDRLINVALPRVRDFHGVGLKFDKGGNYNLGITEQSIFPELTFEETQVLHGLQITFVIKNGNKEASKALLEKFGMPFEKKGGVK